VVTFRCPACGDLLDGAFNIDGRLEPRDWTPALCPCGTLVVYDYTRPGGTRQAETDDWLAWRQDPRLLTAIERAIHAFRKEPDT
jgi:hypothetical protein